MISFESELANTMNMWNYRLSCVQKECKISLWNASHGPISYVFKINENKITVDLYKTTNKYKIKHLDVMIIKIDKKIKKMS